MIPSKRRSGWQYWKIADLLRDGMLEIGDGYRAKNSEMGSSGLPFARAGNVNNGFHFDDADLLKDESVKLAGEKLSRPGDITFTSKGTFGRFAFVRQDTTPFVYSPQLCYWRVKREGLAERRFLYYWMQGADCMTQLNEVKGLTDMADYVSLTNQRRMWFSAPSLPVQRRIASVLSVYDELIENNQQRIKILEEMARSLYREWFVYFHFSSHDKVKMIPSPLGPIPKGWEVVTLKDITSKIGSGATPRGGREAYKTEGVRLIRSLNVYDYQFEFSGLAFIDEAQAAELDNVAVSARDILLNITGASVARCCMVPSYLIPARVNQHVSIVRADPNRADPYYVLDTINSEQRKQQLLAFAQGGATREALTKETIENFPIMLPPRPLLNKYGRCAGALHAQRETLERQCQNLRRTRDLLLPRLLSGQINVNLMEPVA
jgi:type I restriction enzyme, S subunit